MSERTYTKKPTIYTNSNVTSYDRQFSSLTYGFANHNGFIKFSPIKSDFIGKEPKQGDRVYDHDLSESYNISAHDAVLLLEAIEYLQATPTHKFVVYSTGSAEFQREFKIFNPNSVKLGGVFYPNYIIKCTKNIKGEGSKSVYHIFDTSSFSNAAGDEIECDSGFNLFGEFLSFVIENTFSLARHGVMCASSSSATGGKTRQRANQQVEEEVDTESASKDLNSEFDDE